MLGGTMDRVPVVIAFAAAALGGCAFLVDTAGLAGGEVAGDGGDSGAVDGHASVEAGPTAVADGGTRNVLLTAGGDHTCAAIDGTAYCWGRNRNGELGDGTMINAPSPVRVSGLPGPVTSIDSGERHTCAIVAGEVWCWGSAGNGTLGPGASADSALPVKVTGLPAPALEVSAGDQFTCALTSDGRIHCWGYNEHGRLGDGTTVSHGQPSAVVDDNGIKSDFAHVAAEADHACGVSSAGEAFCWGHDDNGALGNPSAGEESARAIPVVGLPGKVERIGIGAWHACAVVAGGAFCWGTGNDGELGNGNMTHSTAPVPVIGHGSGVSLLAAAGTADDGDNTCALRDGVLSCWGKGSEGRLGDGQSTTRATPTPVSGLAGGVTALAGGACHWCAALANGDLMCWGRGTDGQLGDGTARNRFIPTRVNLAP